MLCWWEKAGRKPKENEREIKDWRIALEGKD